MKAIEYKPVKQFFLSVCKTPAISNNKNTYGKKKGKHSSHTFHLALLVLHECLPELFDISYTNEKINT